MTAMDNLPEVVSAEEWLTARRALLAQEKELTRTRDRSAARTCVCPTNTTPDLALVYALRHTVT